MPRLSKPFGEWDTKLKNSIFKSFRFEIVICSLLSLLYTLISEAAVAVLFLGVRSMVENVTGNQKSRMMVNIENLQGKDIANMPKGFYESTQWRPMHFGPATALIVFAVVAGIILFIMYFLLLTQKFANYLEEIAVGINKISAGNFDTRIDIKNEDEFTLIASRLNKMADDIQQIMQKERESESVKNGLITCVAHDLRTPLTSIIGYLDLVSADENLPSEIKKKYISIVYDKSKRLEKLIEDLFAYTKYSSQETVMNLTQVDMVKFMEQLVDEFYPSFQEAGLEYEFKVSHPSVVITADGDLLARAFANLIGNAVKYGKDGKSIRIELLKEREEVIISVTNYGELIPEKDLDNIFDRFYRVETSRSRETGGTGLGLAIAKNIILLHKGSIQVHSDFNGTVFQVRFNEKQEIIQKELEIKVERN